jgi:hypothetical protein
MEVSPTQEASMRVKRVPVRLSDNELNLLLSAITFMAEDMGASGEDAPEGHDELRERLLKARQLVRA